MADGRRPATIFHADVEDYTGRMERDAAGTVRAVKACRSLVNALVAEYGGRVVNSAGDNVLAEFPGAPNALKSAIMVQEGMADLGGGSVDPIRLRIGLHTGSVLVDGDEIFGEDINLAARIQEQAPGGGICLSQAVRDALGQMPGIQLQDRGYHRLKNVAQPVRLYWLEQLGNSRDPDGPARALPRFTPPDVPSIVVLPLRNNSGDPSKEYFSDGISEDLMTDLSRFRELFVIGRASAFSYKYRSVGTSQIGRELGVHYVLEGGVRIGGGRIRLAVNLVEAASAKIVWSDRYDREALDLFQVQEEMSRALVGELIGEVERNERLRLLTKGTESLPAYDLVLRAQQEIHLYERAANRRARDLLGRATELDRNYARAYAALSRSWSLDWRYRWAEDPKAALALSLDLAREAVRLDEGDARGHAELGWALLYSCEHDRSIRAYERALELNPNSADVMAMMADAVSYAGEPARALEMVALAKRLNPRHTDNYFWAEADALFALRRYRDVVDCIGRMRNPAEGCRLLAASYALLDRMDEARACAAEVLRRQPDFSVDDWVGLQPEKDPAEREHFRAGLLKAGLK